MDTTGSFNNAITADLYLDPSFIRGFLKDNVYGKNLFIFVDEIENGNGYETEAETKSDNFNVMNST